MQCSNPHYGKPYQDTITRIYCKFLKISPGAYIFQRPFLGGLFLEGLIHGGAYFRNFTVFKGTAKKTKTNSHWIVLNCVMWNSLIFYHWYLIPYSVSVSVSVSVIPFPFPDSGFHVLVLPCERSFETASFCLKFWLFSSRRPRKLILSIFSKSKRPFEKQTTPRLVTYICLSMDKIWAKMIFWLWPRNFDFARFLQTFALKYQFFV